MGWKPRRSWLRDYLVIYQDNSFLLFISLEKLQRKTGIKKEQKMVPDKNFFAYLDFSPRF
jgi:hypothetical protein